MTRYDAVILGSGVYAGRWIGSAKEFAEKNAEALRARPVWLLSSGPLGETPKPAEDPADAVKMVKLLNPRGHRVFAGALALEEMGFGERTIIKMVKAPYGDFRDWDEIRTWAREIGQELEPIADPARRADSGLSGEDRRHSEMLRLFIVLVLVAHGVGHSIGIAGGWGNNAWGGSGESWLLTPVLGRSAGVLEGLIWLIPAIGFVAAGGALLAGLDAWRALALASIGQCRWWPIAPVPAAAADLLDGRGRAGGPGGGRSA